MGILRVGNKKHKMKGRKKMKPQGRSVVPLTAKQIEAVEEYLGTDKSLIEVSAKYGTTSASIRNWVKKYRKEKGELND